MIKKTACFYYNQTNGKCKRTLEEEVTKCKRKCKYFEHYSKYSIEYPEDRDSDGQILGRCR